MKKKINFYLYLTEEEFDSISHAAINTHMTIKDFIKSAVFEKMFLDIVKKEAESKFSLQTTKTGGSKKD